VNFAPLKMLAGDRARFCARLIAICLSLVTGAALHGQSESTTTNLRSPSYGTAEVAATLVSPRILSHRIPISEQSRQAKQAPRNVVF
jgi:hypothetical protein